MYIHATRRTKGQSLVEVVVAIAIVILIVSGLVVSVITSLRSAQSSRNRSIATKLTQDGMEIIRNLRDNGWNQFITYHSLDPWCMDSSGVLTAPDPVCAPNSTSSSTSFTRTALLTYDVILNRMSVTITVVWTEGRTVKNSSAETYLTQWR
jgi:Tfp pilus assembly protein PilW